MDRASDAALNANTATQEALGDLAAALSGFANQPLREAAAAVLNALGYESNRTMNAGSVAEFLARYQAEDKLTDWQRQLFESWQDVELVFQITDAEVGNASGLLAGGFETDRISSFVFLAVELASAAYSRTVLADMTRAVNRLFAMPVMLVFRCQSRLSLAVIHRRAHRGNDNRDVLERVTLVKDVDCPSPHRAHLEILADLALPKMVDERSVTSFDSLHKAWEDVLDTEELNRRFYRELFRWYLRALETCKFPDDGAGSGGQERQLIRLITRLLFIWFLKEKQLVPDDIFTEEFAAGTVKNYTPEATDYYRAVLQNLFFATLNTEIAKREFSKEAQRTHRDFAKYRYYNLLTDPDSFLAKLKTVPFVNGGLFDCLDDFEGVRKGGRRIDAFTDNVKNQGKDLHVPASILLEEHGLFPLFRRFKFTVEENTPLDQEVALDPELLGRVFENLLAAYNPETRNTVRKATGSYYTPRRIVDYMVDEALVATLTERVASTDGDKGWLEDRLRYLLDYEDAFNDAADLFDPADTEAIVRAIANLRVLDPAVGSGAFPMGTLHKLTLALRRLDPHNTHWERFQKDMARERAVAAFDVRSPDARETELREISQTFEAYRDSDYGRKLYLIQHTIYGVDLQPVACQIARLRFFISLTVEQESTRNDPANNHGIRPLPNLETRIVAANTLIGVAEPNQLELGEAELRQHMIPLARVRETHFNAKTRDDKHDLRKKDARLRSALAEALEEGGYGHDEAQHVAHWDPYSQSAAADWFDARWMFDVADGFDVVIGNPPYVRADFQDEKHQRTRRLLRLDREYETLWEKWDLFVPFMERGFELLREGGVTSLIVSDAFGHAKYALKAREWFLRNARVLRLDFYSNLKLFEAAVHNISYVFQRGDLEGNEPIRRLHRSEFGDVELLDTAQQAELTERAFVPVELYQPPPAPTVPLGDICYVSKGMVVHANERYARGAFALDDVVSDARDDLHPKPFVEGKHLDRWLPARNRWLEWGTDRAPDLFSRPTFPELYTVEEKLLSVDMSASEQDRARVVYDSQGLHHNHSVWAFVPWHALQGVLNRSIRKQARYPGEKLRSKFAHREKLEALSKRFHLKYILGVMNSRSALEFLTAHRRSNIHLYPDDWKKLPIPDVPKSRQQAVVRLVDKILKLKAQDPKASVREVEQQVDATVRGHYGFGNDLRPLR